MIEPANTPRGARSLAEIGWEADTAGNASAATEKTKMIWRIRRFMLRPFVMRSFSRSRTIDPDFLVWSLADLRLAGPLSRGYLVRKSIRDFGKKANTFLSRFESGRLRWAKRHGLELQRQLSKHLLEMLELDRFRQVVVDAIGNDHLLGMTRIKS